MMPTHPVNKVITVFATALLIEKLEREAEDLMEERRLVFRAGDREQAREMLTEAQAIWVRIEELRATL